MSEREQSPEAVVNYYDVFETFGACRLRHGVMYRGRVRAEFAEDIDALHRILSTAPGEYHVERLDGNLYASIRMYRPGKEPKQRLWLHVGLLLLTIITTLGAGAELAGEAPRGAALIPFEFAFHSARRLLRGEGREVVHDLLPQFLRDLGTGVPYAAALLFILLAHEMGHYIAARRYGIDATLPFLLPAPLFFGTFGAVIRMRSPIVHRRALFDVGIAGPIAGLIASFIVCFVGLRLSSHVPLAEAPLVPFELGRSVMFETMRQWVLGPIGPTDALIWHPVAVAGWFGLFITFLNLLPLGQLDGGHMWYALVGPKQRYVGLVAFGVLMGMGMRFPGWIVLAVLVLLVLRVKHPPVIDESTGLGSGRRILGAAMIVVFLLLFIAEPIRAF